MSLISRSLITRDLSQGLLLLFVGNEDEDEEQFVFLSIVMLFFLGFCDWKKENSVTQKDRPKKEKKKTAQQYYHGSPSLQRVTRLSNR